MSQSRNIQAFNELLETFHLFQTDLEQYGAGERYWRSKDRSKDWTAASLKAQSYLELAMEALGEPARMAKEASQRTGWLSRAVKGLSHYLSAGSGEQMEILEANGESELNEAPGIAASSGDGGQLVGQGAVVELPDLIGMIRGQGMTGVLRLEMPAEVVNLHFQAGSLVHAYSENAPKELRLGEVLIELNMISRERLEALLFCHQDSPDMLGETLLNGGLVSPEQLQIALNQQIQTLFDRIFVSRREASFSFSPGLPEIKGQRAQVNVLQLLLDSARAFDEQQAS